MPPEHTPLSDPEQQQARRLWDALMFAATQADLDAAYEQFRIAPAQVREAIVWSSIARKTHERPPRRDENPFD